MRKVLFTLMSVASTADLAATVYKWTDENGVIHYSDQPHENSQKVEVEAPQTYSAPRASNRVGSSANRQTSSSGGPVYQRCAVAQPANDETFMNANSVSVSITVDPTVRAGDQVFVLMDGQKITGLPTTGTQFTISPVDRGTHTLQAIVQDPNGRTLCASGSVTFHVHQPSVLNPANPLRRK